MSPDVPRIHRRSARVILLDDADRLVLIRRVRTDLPERGTPVYWTTPGGGVEASDASREAAAEREAFEEAGARVVLGPQVLLTSWRGRRGTMVNHFFLARVIDIDAARRHGPEFADEARGTLETDPLPIEEVAGIDLRPPELRSYVVDNWPGLLSEAALLRSR